MAAVSDIGVLALAMHCGATMLRVCASFVAGFVVGFGAGVLMQYSTRMWGILNGAVEASRPVPPVALIPFFILVFGFSELGKFLVASIGVALIVVVATVEALERVDKSLIRWGLVRGLTRRSLFSRVLIPAAWPEMRGGGRIALAASITLVVVAEFMGASAGLGYLISVAKVTLSTATLVLAVLCLGLLGGGLDFGVRRLFDLTTAWDIRAKGAFR